MGTQREPVTFTKDTAVRRGLRALAAVLLAASGLAAADLDNDGLDDAWEAANGYNTSLYTRIVYVDAANGDDDAGDGGTAATALRSLGAALALNFTEGDEIVVLVAPGTYSGAANRGLDFGGRDIWLRASGGAAQTIIDLEGAGRLLSLTGGETLASRLDGFTVRNGYMASCGIAVHLENASLDIRGCVFEDNRSGRRETYDHGDGQTETWWTDACSTAAIYASGAPVRITGTVFRRNASTETMYGGMGTDSAGALVLADADGSVVEDCLFLGNSGRGAGAVALYGTEAIFRRCRFRRNVSLTGGGGVSASALWDWETGGADGGSVVLESCLLLGNRAFGDHSDLLVGAGCTATLRHVTASGGTSRGGHAIRLEGDADISDSILDGALSLGEGAVLAADR